MRTLSTLDQAIHTNLLIMEGLLVDMLENINIARHDLNHHSRNAAIGALLSQEKGYRNLGTLYQAVLAMHQHAEFIYDDTQDDTAPLQDIADVTHPDYWDCDCKQNYIHRKSDSCKICGAYDPDHHPDSMTNEIPPDMLK
jgi:hypothetical protein